MIIENIFDEVVDFIASRSPKDVIAFRPSEKASERYEQLIFKEKNEGLDGQEKKELNNYQVLEYIMRRAKAKARLLLAS
ncbi:MAG: hypothetical protein R3B93_20770 [Bacteroidia bacterium]